MEWVWWMWVHALVGGPCAFQWYVQLRNVSAWDGRAPAHYFMEPAISTHSQPIQQEWVGTLFPLHRHHHLFPLHQSLYVIAKNSIFPCFLLFKLQFLSSACSASLLLLFAIGTLLVLFPFILVAPSTEIHTYFCRQHYTLLQYMVTDPALTEDNLQGSATGTSTKAS